MSHVTGNSQYPGYKACIRQSAVQGRVQPPVASGWPFTENWNDLTLTSNLDCQSQSRIVGHSASGQSAAHCLLTIFWHLTSTQFHANWKLKCPRDQGMLEPPPLKLRAPYFVSPKNPSHKAETIKHAPTMSGLISSMLWISVEKHGMGILDCPDCLDSWNWWLMMIAYDLAQWNECKMAKAKRGQSTEELDFNESQVYQPSSRFKEVI